MEVIDSFLSSKMCKKVRDPVFVLRTLEVPRIPFIPFSYLDKKVLQPMRWVLARKMLGAESALKICGGSGKAYVADFNAA